MRHIKGIFFLSLFVYIILATPVYAMANAQFQDTERSGENYNFEQERVNADDRYASQSPKGKKLSIYSGSGFFIAPNVVVTSNHVISGASSIEIVYNNEIKRTAVVIDSDKTSDLALLRVVGLEDVASPLVLANSDSMREGSRVYAVGFPLPVVMGMGAKLSEGIISSNSGLRDDLRIFQISTPVQPGNSGGPLLNEQAEVVGVVTGGLNAINMMKQGIIPQNVNYAVKINNLCKLMDNSSLNIGLVWSLYGGSLSAADVMDIAKKAVVFIVVSK
ncbi:MAG: hypothetical protein H6Q68_1208 [Firmicutes bacterium]|nr:hypothetical protein [Bacillota bacterium]